MKRKHQTGPFDRRYLYLMLHSSLLRCKIGISNWTERRAVQVSDSVRGRVWPVLQVRVFFAGFWEAVLHTLFGFFRWRMRGDGGTEFFLIVVFPFAFVLVLLIKIFDMLLPVLIIIAIGYFCR